MAITNYNHMNEENEIEKSEWKKLIIKRKLLKEELKTGIPSLSPSWTLLILGDGSPTIHFQLLTRVEIAVDVIQCTNINFLKDDAPEEINLIPGPRVRREVYLVSSKGEKLAYAASWWNETNMNSYFKDKMKPIGAEVNKRKAELFREIRGVYQGISTELETEFGYSGPFWGRHYLFWHNGQPLTLIYEVFSPVLENYMGPMNLKIVEPDEQNSISSPYLQ